MQEYVPSSYEVENRPGGTSDTAIYLSCTEPCLSMKFSFEAIRPNLFRTAFTDEDHPLPPYPSASKPVVSLGESKWSTRWLGPKWKELNFNNVCVHVNWTGPPIVSIRIQGTSVPLHQDLPFRSYAVDGNGIAHYSRYERKTLHVGLGEKATPMDLSSRQFVLSATDCFGYDVDRTDPMYKHIPLLINATPDGCVGLFSTSHSRGTYSVGSEMDGLWGPYKVYKQDHGGLEEYLIVGKTLKEVVRTYAELVGFPLLVPRWALGYLAGGMKYSMLDEPRACDALLDFADKLKHYDIPCSGFQLSSGYTVAEIAPKTRNVFTWNRHRFPNPKTFVDAYRSRGLRIIANVKPYVLETHPEYRQLADANALFRDPRDGNQSAVARLWSAGGGESGEGGHIDFTSAAGFNWWVDGVKSLRKLGIECIWNDNNEYTLPDDNWECAMDSAVVAGNRMATPRRDVGLWGRSMQTELMGKASHDALLAVKPHERPFVLTRSATAGTMRYAASSWSGDNVTSWAGMKGANALSLNAGICLLQCYGHDIGGFEGPQPTPELLLRWIQLGIHSPRFAINCYKTSPDDNSVGDVIEPWMYPEITTLVRKAIKRRYQLIPYLYSLILVSHQTAEPPLRWVGWGCESDNEVWGEGLRDGERQYWLGDSLLVGGVYEPGVNFGKVYLPKCDGEKDHDAGYLNLNPPYQHFASGQWVEVSSKWKESIPLFARCGTVVPVGRDEQTLAPGESMNSAGLARDDWRGVEIFPPPASAGAWKRRVYGMTWLEDDGISTVEEARISSYTIEYRNTEKGLVVGLARDESSGFKALWQDLDLILPVGDVRDVVSGDGVPLKELGVDAQGRRVWRLDGKRKEKGKTRL